ncbi:MAG: hypothetical protein EXS30_02270 [Pedosphaera sp.]|nr:hypothetical protein [Pedosphaera sp.]
MRLLVDTKDSAAVEFEVQASYLGMYPNADRFFVPKAFSWALNCFTGKYRDYQPIDARYHDLEHTMQGTLCMVRLLRGRHEARVEPLLTQRMFKLGLLAILLHDTGYLKTKMDHEGTGAKYTLIHVSRSLEFAAALLGEQEFEANDIAAVQNMIRCTGANVELKSLLFQDELERSVGFALGTADLLGQMAAEDYVEKLPILYQEFAESERFSAGKTNTRAMFSSASDLMQKTHGFWSFYVQDRIKKGFQGAYFFLNDPYPDGPNIYVELIEANLERLQRQLSATAAA